MYRNNKRAQDEQALLREIARKHTEDMDKEYASEIKESIEKSRVYGGPDGRPKRNSQLKNPQFIFINVDSVSALKLARKKAAVLNFASYKNPGGRFYDGSKAQEEMLCHSSFLYNVLRSFTGYYEWNRNNINRGLYKDRCIYSPGVLFEGKKSVDVITCAAPNLRPAIRYKTSALQDNEKFLRRRIEFIRDVAEEQGVETVILGAFGCGVFKQDPTTVANMIKEIFNETSIENVVIAVPGNDKNFIAFKEVFGEPRKIRAR